MNSTCDEIDIYNSNIGTKWLSMHVQYTSGNLAGTQRLHTSYTLFQSSNIYLYLNDYSQVTIYIFNFQIYNSWIMIHKITFISESIKHD